MAIPFTFNIAKGRVAELYNRVESGDPSGCRLVLIPCSAGDTEANAQDADTVTAALATAINEQSAGGWVRVDLGPTELAAFPAPNDTDNRYDVALPETSFGSPTAGSDTTHLLVAYDPTGSAADSALVPISFHAFAVTADGNEVVLNAGNFMQSS